MPRKLELKDEQLRDGFNVEFPELNFSRFTPETEAIYNDEQDRTRYERGKEQMEMEEAQAAMRTLVDRVNPSSSMSNNNLVALAFCREMAGTNDEQKK